MTPHSVFICAAYSSAPLVRTMHTTLRNRGVECLSGWADEAGDEPEDLAAYPIEKLREFWHNNRRGIRQADTIIIMADTPMREGHAEAEYARIHGKRILWCGRPTLTAEIFAYPTVANAIEAIDAVLAAVRPATLPAPTEATP